MIANKRIAGDSDAAQSLTFLQRFLNKCCNEKEQGLKSAADPDAGVALHPTSAGPSADGLSEGAQPPPADGSGGGDDLVDDDFARVNVSTGALED